jgi:hypothetical protein
VDLQDLLAARQLLPLLHNMHPRVRHLWADGGYHGTLAEWAKTTLGITIGIVNKLAGQTSFIALLLRWVVERTFLDHPRPPQRP